MWLLFDNYSNLHKIGFDKLTIPKVFHRSEADNYLSIYHLFNWFRNIWLYLPMLLLFVENNTIK